MEEKQIPYKIYLEESEMPKTWYNVRADMENKPAPLLNPGTLKPMTAEELSGVFCEELVAQELDIWRPGLWSRRLYSRLPSVSQEWRESSPRRRAAMPSKLPLTRRSNVKRPGKRRLSCSG